MKVYVSHSSSYDFVKELYEPLKNSNIWNQHEFFLPHEGKPVNTREVISNSEIVLAEVSYPSTGQGIELGWASCYGKRIIAMHRQGKLGSSSIKFIAATVIEYSSPKEMISKIEAML